LAGVSTGTLGKMVVRLIYCPLILPQSGVEPFFQGMPDQKFELKDDRILDVEIVVLDCRPDGRPNYAR
jgi:hypothetical protein